jgi:hypothetical protein
MRDILWNFLAKMVKYRLSFEGDVMTNFWKNILCLFSACFFCSSAKADDLDPLSSAYLSDKKYAKNIEVKTYLVTKDQVARLFSEASGEITQKSNKELFGREVFLLVRCKNIGDYRAFGTINCKRSIQGTPISIETALMPGYMKFFYDTVLPLGSGSVPNNNEIPIISYEWKYLCVI